MFDSSLKKVIQITQSTFMNILIQTILESIKWFEDLGI